MSICIMDITAYSRDTVDLDNVPGIMDVTGYSRDTMDLNVNSVILQAEI